jgi:ATP-dependent Clp protease ATP-binding subunit ClpC
MVERSLSWSPELERVVQRATEQARSVGHRRVGSEHLLLALLAQPEGAVTSVLEALRLKFDEVRAEIMEVMPGTSRPIEGNLPMTESAAGALRRAEAVARRLKAEQVDTDHLLLGVAAQHESAASRVLLDFGATTEKVRRLVEEETRERQTQACRECGQALEPAWRFCPMCGTSRVSR